MQKQLKKTIIQRLSDQETNLDNIIIKLLEGVIDDDHDLANKLENISHEIMSIKMSIKEI